MWAGETQSTTVVWDPGTLEDITHVLQWSGVTFLGEALAELASGSNNLHFHNTSVTFVLDILQFLYLAEYFEIIAFSSCR